MRLKITNIILRIIAYPFILAIILIRYNYHAIHNSILVLIYGGEWITYAKNDSKATIGDIYNEIKSQSK